MKRYIALAACALTISASMLADYPAGYYNALNGKTGLELMHQAKSIVARHTVISYGDKTWEAFETTDVTMVDGKKAWWDMYSDNVVYVADGHSGLNIEHSVANSWWGKTKNDAYKDLFHLNPSDATANNRKANYPLGEISGTPTWTNGVTNVGRPVSGQGGGSTYVFEPEDCYKGDFARAFMYIFTVYDDISWKDNTAWMYSLNDDLMFQQWARTLLLKWNDADPVDTKETNRNEAIYKIQKNRNPYIDLPNMCHYIWGSLSGTPFEVANGSGPVVDPDVPENGVLLDQNFENTSSISAVEAQGWWNDNTEGTLKWYVTDYDGNKYAAASAYKGTADGGPYEMWLVTPALQTKKDASMTLTFRTQGAYGVEGSYLEAYAMSTSDPRTATLTKLNANICTPNAVGVKPVYSDWVQSGNVEIPHTDEALYIGFKYYAAKGGSNNSATYCLDDVKVVTDAIGGVDETQFEELCYTVAGGEGAIRIMSPVEVSNVNVFDLSGRRVANVATVAGDYVLTLPAGLYIVVTDGRPTRKVIVK